jgi:hypothetical protein
MFNLCLQIFLKSTLIFLSFREIIIPVKVRIKLSFQLPVVSSRKREREIHVNNP